MFTVYDLDTATIRFLDRLALGSNVSFLYFKVFRTRRSPIPYLRQEDNQLVRVRVGSSSSVDRFIIIARQAGGGALASKLDS